MAKTKEAISISNINFFKHKDPINQNYWCDDALHKWLAGTGISEILVANSFIKNYGVSHFKNKFKKLVKEETVIRIIYGEDFGITEASAIRELIKIGCIVRVCKPRGGAFHPKFLIINYKNSDSILCAGSSNFTGGGLRKNVEFNISLNANKKLLKESIAFFDNLWNISEKIDEEYLSQYENLEKAQKRYDPFEKVPLVLDEELLVDFMNSWINKIKREKTKEGCLEWRGWYLFPEHGNLNREKLIELKKICEALFMLSDRNKVIRIDNSQAGLAKVAKVISHAKITYAHEYDIQTKRAWLVRQQLNYLEKLRLILKVKPGLYQVKQLGVNFVGLETDKLQKFFTQRIEDIGWIWGNIKYVSFLKKLLLLLPDRKITEKEFSYFVSHSHYNEEQLYILELILKFRNAKNKDKFIQKQDKRIKEEILTHRTPHAHSHYLSKTRSLMKDLGYCLNFKAKQIDDQMHLILSQ